MAAFALNNIIGLARQVIVLNAFGTSGEMDAFIAANTAFNRIAIDTDIVRALPTDDQVIADGKAYRKFLKPGDKPQAEFKIKADKIEVREYCNIHGLWSSSLER